MSNRGPGFIVRQSFTAAELAAEEWRDVAGGKLVRFQVSSLGRFRSQWLSPTKPQGWRWPTMRAAAMTHYLTVKIRKRNRAIHVLVLEAFHCARPEGTEGAHLNGNRIDARACNLAWVSAVENQAHKQEHGTQPQGGLHYAAKLNEASVREIRAALLRGETQASLARKYAISDSVICNIKAGRTWKHVA